MHKTPDYKKRVNIEVVNMLRFLWKILRKKFKPNYVDVREVGKKMRGGRNG